MEFIEKHIKNLETFQKSFGSVCNESFTELPIEYINLRENLYDEEVEEFLKANRLGDKVEILDALTDELFLLLGDVVSVGVKTSFLDGLEGILKHNSETMWWHSDKDFAAYALINSRMTYLSEKSVSKNLQQRFSLIAMRAKNLYGKEWYKVLDRSLTAVFESNMSKLDEDGKPIVNGEKITDPTKPLGKILKSDRYFPPTEKLKRILELYSI